MIKAAMPFFELSASFKLVYRLFRDIISFSYRGIKKYDRFSLEVPLPVFYLCNCKN